MNQSASCQIHMKRGPGQDGESWPKIHKLQILIQWMGGRPAALFMGEFGTNAAAASTVIQHLQKSPMLTSNMF